MMGPPSLYCTRHRTISNNISSYRIASLLRSANKPRE
ncbi:RAD protein [Plasmodium cynomolgi strain B]|uniref:RAD protein n=1 Tax=Plasmodium cynomolgi (strain B) TaxID=1120755 RepID=K6UJL2_PLACD|nr:RAD protein [Plasmodium cynomolgi strain B]GAB66023.1 RAD protein [Plasmodium cynomolgi strain B]